MVAQSFCACMDKNQDIQKNNVSAHIQGLINDVGDIYLFMWKGCPGNIVRRRNNFLKPKYTMGSHLGGKARD